MALAIRRGKIQPFTRLTERADGRQNGFEIGFVTYSTPKDGVETYQVTSVEFAGRSDHLADVATGLMGDDVTLLNTESPLEGDADLMRKPEEAKSSKSDEQPTEATA